ncbi:MAG: DNA/RNA nuclease SfsA [Ruminococcus sp.]|nr:DNA/RNA nuclease SfsA [Ruminococcus sp.]
MIYENIVEGNFLSRPNRFIAKVNIDGREQTVHVKNTGRCRELLTENARVLCEHFPKGKRKTDYDLISVYKGDRLINMDSQAPNRVFGEFLRSERLFRGIDLIKPETKFGDSRFDFYIEAEERKIFAEVKGVTLEENGVVLFPDAPTQRGVKHLNELVRAVKEGYEAFAVFVVQMENVRYFTPNAKTHPEFTQALINARNSGVNLLCYDCRVTENSLEINNPVEIAFNSIFNT